MVNELIRFDLCGKAAHFRKYYSSTSAFSHTIPPKTTIAGIVAAILGLERDSYYQLFDKWAIGVHIQKPLRKLFQKMNYLNIENIKHDDIYATGLNKRTQIAVEHVLPENIRESELCYRIYIGVEDPEDANYEQLKDRLQNNQSVFGCSLGSAHLQGYFKNYAEISDFNLLEETGTYKLKSAALTNTVQLMLNGNSITVEQDTIPLHIKLNEKDKNGKTRYADRVESLIYPLEPEGIDAQIISADNFIYFPEENFVIQLL